jgi:NAD(P)-dependent dehydrogenase (short-subunit alcohol dehydrogenase family)
MAQVALITGAASGIGRQLALRLSRNGWAVGALDVNGEALASLEQELEPRASSSATADVTDRQALFAAVARLEERLGPVDRLIASAGVGFETSALCLDAQALETIIRVNLIGVSNSFAAVLSGMIARKRGHLVALSSLASFRGLPRMAGYCASKAGLNALLDAFRVELAPLGITVTTICPGWVRTPMTAGLDVPMPGLLELDAAASHILKAMDERRAFCACPPGSARRLRVLRFLPHRASDWLLNRVLGSLQDKT